MRAGVSRSQRAPYPVLNTAPIPSDVTLLPCPRRCPSGDTLFVLPTGSSRQITLCRHSLSPPPSSHSVPYAVIFRLHI